MLHTLKFSCDLPDQDEFILIESDDTLEVIKKSDLLDMGKGNDYVSLAMSTRTMATFQLDTGIYIIDTPDTVDEFVVTSAPYLNCIIHQLSERLDMTGLPVTKSPDQTMAEFLSTTLPTHGVADNIEQIKHKYANIINSNANVLILLREICQQEDDAPESRVSNWAWADHGDYIGDETPTHRFLHEEEWIEEVLEFSIMLVTPE